ncbi:MAG TPA: DUF6603 domain-containing protein [Blastocatellia bacterium]|nr:DUF6603 domain-containing protein [Blastocatellia bacterium]
MNNPGTLEQIALLLAEILQPLKEDVANNRIIGLFTELGVRLTPAQANQAALKSALNAVVNNISQMVQKVTALIAAVEASDIGKIISLGLEVLNLAKDVISGFTQIANAINGMGIAGFDAGKFPERLFNYLLFHHLDKASGVNELLEFAGVLERQDFNVNSNDPNKPPYSLYTYHWNKLGAWLDNAGQQLQTRYGWGTNSFDGKALFAVLQRILARAGVPVIYDKSGPLGKLDIVLAEIVPKPDLNPDGLQITIKHKIDGFKETFAQDDWQVEAGLSGQLGSGAQIILQANDGLTIIPPTGDFKGDTYLQWTGGKANGDPTILLGQADGSRIEAKQLIARAGAGFAWNAGSNRAEGTLKISAEIKGGKIVISLAGADGFLGKILAGFGLESEFDLGLGFSTKEGIFFFGSAALEIQLPLHVTLGPVDLSALTISVGVQGSKFPVGLSLNIKASLGPLLALVEQIGMQAELSFPANGKGNAGPVDVGLGFKPPKGIGLSLDVGVVKGGGYLYFDFEREEYAGALELVFSGFITLKAIGLLTTRMPDGSKGFSLLIIITAEFGTGIQLGFGFTLLGVGGLVGLNRTMLLQPLMEGVRTGAINSIMFPQDVIANAPRIISDLRKIFPPEEGKFLIGPMAKLGWGTPTLISLALGIIIEIPGNIAIVGVLKMALPTDQLAILILQVNFAGAIEFDKKRFFFFASLFDSRVLTITIEGDMGVLAAFGDDANFVISVGGFHPRFNPPPLPFPTPRRVAFDIVNTPVYRIRVEGYFALTSNTAQFGARAELQMGFSDFGIEGHIAFDALLQFSPFYFIIEISASVSLKAFGVGLFSIRLRFSLEGPTPWRAKGSGSISLLFFEISADFDVTWGEARDTTLPPIAVMPLLQAEFEKPDNWQALLPAGANLLVSLRKLTPAPGNLVLHPVGTLRVSQKAVPLDLPIDKVGSQKPNDAKRFDIKPAGDSGLAKRADKNESFALAQFQNMDDAAKLSRPAYQSEHGGLELSAAGQTLAATKAVKRVVRYEEIIIDSNYKRFVRRFFGFFGTLFTHFLRGNAVSKSVLSQQQKQLRQPFDEKITVNPEMYVVAYQANNKAFSTGAVSFQSEASARAFLQSQVAVNPSLHDSLHVIAGYEING